MSERRTDPEVLARRLDLALPPGKKSVPPVTADPLVNTAAELAKLPVPAFSAETSRRVEARMLAAFEAQYHPRDTQRPRRRVEPVLRWALVASLALVLLLVGLTPAVAVSLPGEPLYSVKQLYEKIELAAATTSSAKAGVYLQQADRRTQEALTLLERSQFNVSLITQALADVAAASKSENDLRASARLRGQLLQVQTALTFILRDAELSGLTSSAAVAPLSQQLQQIGNSDLLLPPPTATPNPTALPTNTLVPTEQATKTPPPTRTATALPTNTAVPTVQPTETPQIVATSPSSGSTPACPERGNSCQSQGVPGGVVIPQTPQGNPGGNSNAGGNGNDGNGNAGGNGNGNGNGGGNGNGNGGGNGNGNGNGGGNGNGNGGGKP